MHVSVCVCLCALSTLLYILVRQSLCSHVSGDLHVVSGDLHLVSWLQALSLCHWYLEHECIAWVPNWLFRPFHIDSKCFLPCLPFLPIPLLVSHPFFIHSVIPAYASTLLYQIFIMAYPYPSSLVLNGCQERPGRHKCAACCQYLLALDSFGPCVNVTDHKALP